MNKLIEKRIREVSKSKADTLRLKVLYGNLNPTNELEKMLSEVPRQEALDYLAAYIKSKL